MAEEEPLTPADAALVRQRRGDGVRDYRFPDAPDLRVLVGDRGIEVRVIHEGEVFDTLIDLDIEPRRDAAGYYCAWCKDAGHVEHFPDRATLLAQHAFEPFAEWCREMLRADKRLVLERNPRGSTIASIWDCHLIVSTREQLQLRIEGGRRW